MTGDQFLIIYFGRC